jgi:hypothetical protein
VVLAGTNARVEVRVDALLAQLGRRTFEIGPDHVLAPDGWTALRTEPGRVRLSLVAQAAAPPR